MCMSVSNKGTLTSVLDFFLSTLNWASVPLSIVCCGNFSTEFSFIGVGQGQSLVCLEWERRLGMPDCFLNSCQTVFILDSLHSTSRGTFISPILKTLGDSAV